MENIFWERTKAHFSSDQPAWCLILSRSFTEVEVEKANVLFTSYYLLFHKHVTAGMSRCCIHTSRWSALMNSFGSKGAMSLDWKRVCVINHGLALCQAEEISLGMIIEKKFTATHAADNGQIIAASAKQAAKLNGRVILRPMCRCTVVIMIHLKKKKVNVSENK